jgi:hypothetical protein
VKSGRPPGWLLDPSSACPVDQDLAAVDSRGRLTISARLLNGIPWVGNKGKSECLLQLEEPGRLSLAGWDETHAEILAVRAQLVASAELRTLRRFEDRHRRVQLDAGRQLQLPQIIIVDLGITHEQRYIYVVRLGTALELWSLKYRDDDNALRCRT